MHCQIRELIYLVTTSAMDVPEQSDPVVFGQRWIVCHKVGILGTKIVFQLGEYIVHTAPKTRAEYCRSASRHNIFMFYR